MPMKQPRNWKKLPRHPLSALYPDLQGWEKEDFLAGFRETGMVKGKKITLYEGKVLDGWQRQLACVELNIKPEYQPLPKGTDPEDFVAFSNDLRRHEDSATRKARRQKRIERVAQARANGESLRAIAEQAGVSVATIQTDIDTLTVQGCTVEPPEGKVTGKDGRTRTATPARPPEIVFCSGCQRKQRVGMELPSKCPDCLELRKATMPENKPRKEGNHRASRKSKNGRPIFDDRIIEDHIGKLVRALNDRSKAYGGECPEYKEVREKFNHLIAAWKRWQIVKEKK